MEKKGHYEIKDRYAYSTDGHLIDLAGYNPTFSFYDYTFKTIGAVHVYKRLVWVEEEIERQADKPATEL